jgi:predicted RNA-binding Zn ribbon-like protein
MKRPGKIAIAAITTLGLGAAVAVFAHPSGTGPGMMHEMRPGVLLSMGPGMMRGMGPGMIRGRGPGANHPMAGPMAAGVQHDAAFRADMGRVHDMFANHESIKRTVANLPDGIRTVTESDDPEVAQAIKAHVASMEQRLKDGRHFNLFSPTIPVLFESKDKIMTAVEVTAKGVRLVQTSDDPKVVTALQQHAEEVSELARDGMVAMMRGMHARMMQADTAR